MLRFLRDAALFFLMYRHLIKSDSLHTSDGNPTLSELDILLELAALRQSVSSSRYSPTLKQPFLVLIKSHILVIAPAEYVQNMYTWKISIYMSVPKRFTVFFSDTWHLYTGANDSLNMSH